MPSAHASFPTTHFPADRAFIVKFCDTPAADASGLLGRVEHLVSGRQAAFRSMEELAVAIVECQTGTTAARSNA
mgnify:FL=1